MAMDLAGDNPEKNVPAPQSLTRARTNVTSLTRSRSNAWQPHVPDKDNSDATELESADVTTSPINGKLNRYEVGWRRVVRNFSPSWFSVTTGTGVVSLLFITIPFQSNCLYWFSVAFFGLNTILFTAAFTISVLRYALYPEIFRVMLADPNNSFFLGTIPMGFATLIESWINLCCPYWGSWAVYVAWAAWMLNAVTALVITTGLSYLLISQLEIKSLERITAIQLLPIAATIVASGAGAQVAAILPDPDQAIITLIINYVLWGMSMPLSFIVLSIYYSRLILHKLPPREVIVSSFLPLGPLGTGGYAIMYLGRVTREVLTRVSVFKGITIAGDLLYVLGIFLALIMWAFGLTWLTLALLTILSNRPFPFNMGFWGFTFPLGVFAISTITLGVELPSFFFKILGTILGIAVMLLWCVVATGTARGAWNGKLFYAPCLENLPKHQQFDFKAVEAETTDTARKA